MPLVLLHGNAPPASLAPIADALAVDHRVVEVHRPGYGDASDSPAAPAEAVSAMVLEALHERGIDRFDVVGHSYGAYVALRLALAAPDQVELASLLSPLPSVAPDEVELFRGAAAALLEGQDLTDVLLARWVAPAFAAAHPALPDTLRAWVDGDRRGLAEDLSIAADEPDLDVERIACPVLVRVGALDAATPPERARGLADRLPEAHVDVVEGVGHLLALEDPTGTASALRRFHRRPS